MDAWGEFSYCHLSVRSFSSILYNKRFKQPKSGKQIYGALAHRDEIVATSRALLAEKAETAAGLQAPMEISNQLVLLGHADWMYLATTR